MAITIGNVTSHDSVAWGTTPNVSCPSGGATGDHYLLFVAVTGGNTVTWPTGFTEVSTYVAETSFGRDLRAAVRPYDGSEPGTFSCTGNAVNTWSIACAVIKGANGTPDVVSQAVASSTWGTTVNLNGASITTTGANRTVLWLGMTLMSDTPGTLTPPSGFTTIVNHGATSDGHCLVAAHGTQASAGAASYSGTMVYGSSDSRGGGVLTVAFAEASGGSSPGNASCAAPSVSASSPTASARGAARASVSLQAVGATAATAGASGGATATVSLAHVTSSAAVAQARGSATASASLAAASITPAEASASISGGALASSSFASVSASAPQASASGAGRASVTFSSVLITPASATAYEGAIVAPTATASGSRFVRDFAS